MQPTQGMFGGQGMWGMSAPSRFVPPPPQMVPSPSRKKSKPKLNFDSDAVKRVGKIAGGIGGLVVMLAISFLIRNGFQMAFGHLSWKPHHSVQGRFRVEFPGKPEVKSRPMYTSQGTLTMWAEGVEVRRGSAFLVTYLDLPASIDANEQEVLNEIVTGMGPQIRITRTNTVDYAGHRGREVYFTAKVRTTTLYCRAKIIMVGRRIYQVQYLGRQGTEQDAEVERYFNSFDAG